MTATRLVIAVKTVMETDDDHDNLDVQLRVDLTDQLANLTSAFVTDQINASAAIRRIIGETASEQAADLARHLEERQP